jgi:RNA-directed DNA polymerase
MKKFDVFFSYSSSDRDAVVLPLLASIEAAGLRAWCDVYEIRWGDSIVEKIQGGLSRSAFVIAFISESYLGKRGLSRNLMQVSADKHRTT